MSVTNSVLTFHAKQECVDDRVNIFDASPRPLKWEKIIFLFPKEFYLKPISAAFIVENIATIFTWKRKDSPRVYRPRENNDIC